MVSYAFSRADLRLSEEWTEPRRPAPWDRRHQGATRVWFEVSERWSGHLTWLVASGRPNELHDLVPEGRVVSGEPARLAPYHRLDAALQYERRIAGIDAEAQVTAFNVYDRDNPRYRQLVGVINQRPPGARMPFEFTGVNVYDLGFQPSFRLAATW